MYSRRLVKGRKVDIQDVTDDKTIKEIKIYAYICQNFGLKISLLALAQLFILMDLRRLLPSSVSILPTSIDPFKFSCMISLDAHLLLAVGRESQTSRQTTVSGAQRLRESYWYI